MKHLIIYVHPKYNSLNNNLLQQVTNTLESQNHKVKIRDLYAMRFDPVLSLQDMQGWHAGQVSDDVKTEQEYILWADQITFIYPIWWTGLPAVMKGYIDRVFSYGFAYRYDQGIQKGLLKGKKAVIINTHGKSHEEYQQSGMDTALALTSDLGIFTYCGLEIVRHFFFDKADKASPENIEQWKMQIADVYQSCVSTH